ncbi:hypothetical protein [Saccharothrix variisporea]|uniref:Excalibur calcium-binding domain-containing protein n=1 Tax=Saccharothrix variisporea TaxID=543527 RepID=A0A495XDY9_9PSEU|nr:hypothetical protein [Saccharothrix variisporea]RKT71889.1 hypothetical protein DFJ66_5188 [Saccharothrix variisporea]
MSRRLAFAGAIGALASGALLTLVISVDQPRPVDVRRVDLSPVQPGVLSATHTTTVNVQPPADLPVSTGTAEPSPAVPVTATSTPEPTTTTTEPPPTSTAKKKPKGNNCDDGYLTDGVCVPWFFPMDPREACEWLRDQGLTRIEVLGRDRHHLDLDLDGVACEWDGD